jgi:hypothetical protein
MAIHFECPGCNATLQVDESLAGKQGKCIHCGQRLIVPSGGGKAVAPSGSSKSTIGGKSTVAATPVPISLFEATPEAMMRELSARGQSAVLFLFKPTDEGSYDMTEMPDADLKCIGTEDVTAARVQKLSESIAKRFGPRKQAAAAPGSAVGPGSSVISAAGAPYLYELKGDRLGMSLDEFKRKYARGMEGSSERLPVCSDEAWGANKAALHSQPWHTQAGIIHARTDHPAENNSPTIGGAKTDLLLYHFVDKQLFRITAVFPTDVFHLVSDAALAKYGPPHDESQHPRQLIWENPVSSVSLLRGTVHPPKPSTLILLFKPLAQIAESRAPQGMHDI